MYDFQDIWKLSRMFTVVLKHAGTAGNFLVWIRGPCMEKRTCWTFGLILCIILNGVSTLLCNTVVEEKADRSTRNVLNHNQEIIVKGGLLFCELQLPCIILKCFIGLLTFIVVIDFTLF
jgi:hypothetical protein